ncbi:MAG: hypothetical protein QNJ58_15100 [Desulfobacterales bacterium]|nr:hypothetical protein [Desulfobacterales bacterium]
MADWTAYLEANSPRYLEELIDFLRIPSISSLPEHAADVQRAAGWVAERLKTAGIEAVQILPTAGHPVVFGQWLHAPDEFFRLSSFNRGLKAYGMILEELSR